MKKKKMTKIDIILITTLILIWTIIFFIFGMYFERNHYDTALKDAICFYKDTVTNITICNITYEVYADKTFYENGTEFDAVIKHNRSN